MAAAVEEHPSHCPYCGESITLLLDTSAQGQTYVEDCEVCCQPLEVAFAVDATGDVVQFSVRRLDE
ncbi:CPXCG motif-containing cysteine-rich protein [Ramlibacter sp.]|uniref:CPXCG motif-containing cysteine-rich protein n=1 Tax=Ramlibacter sp. TaxID=1917967 RepID=UPI003D0CA11B